MDKNPENRIIISTFSSQLHRLQIIMEEAAAHGRKVAIAGYSMIQTSKWRCVPVPLKSLKTPS